jgi:hypothetical protein
MLFKALVSTTLNFCLCIHGAVVPRQPEPQSHHATLNHLTARQFPDNSITGYEGNNIYQCQTEGFTWPNVNQYECYSWVDADGMNQPMGSLMVANFDSDVVVVVWEDLDCNSDGWNFPVPAGTTQCITRDIGLISFSIVLT